MVLGKYSSFNILQDEGNGTSLDTLTLAVALNCTNNSSSCISTGTVSLSSALITLEANETGIILRNLTNDVYSSLCDANTDWPTVILDAKVYGLDEYAITSNFSSVDLCSTELEGVEEYFIDYFEII